VRTGLELARTALALEEAALESTEFAVPVDCNGYPTCDATWGAAIAASWHHGRIHRCTRSRVKLPPHEDQPATTQDDFGTVRCKLAIGLVIRF
jgi:hypothetical protein